VVSRYGLDGGGAEGGLPGRSIGGRRERSRSTQVPSVDRWSLSHYT
jgi:hypothetical protein